MKKPIIILTGAAIIVAAVILAVIFFLRSTPSISCPNKSILVIDSHTWCLSVATNRDAGQLKKAHGIIKHMANVLHENRRNSLIDLTTPLSLADVEKTFAGFNCQDSVVHDPISDLYFSVSLQGDCSRLSELISVYIKTDEQPMTPDGVIDRLDQLKIHSIVISASGQELLTLWRTHTDKIAAIHVALSPDGGLPLIIAPAHLE